MIDLKECIKFCIENFTVEEATERLYKFVNDSLELKEKEIELRNSIKIPEVLKEPTIEYLNENIEAIYGLNCDETGWTVLVDPSLITEEGRKLINRFLIKNSYLYKFVFESRKTTCNKFN